RDDRRDRAADDRATCPPAAGPSGARLSGVLVLSRAEVEELLDVDALVDALATAMADLSAGLVSTPPRVAARVSDRAAMLAVMPAFLPSAGALVTKLVSLFPENRDRPTHQAVICC